jgi:hypothetical protein
MKPAVTRFLKLNLEKESKRCGTCFFCSKYEITVYSNDYAKLKAAAKEILDVKPNGVILRSESVIALLCLALTWQNEKVHCRKEHVWTHFLGPACSFWMPRVEKESIYTLSTEKES